MLFMSMRDIQTMGGNPSCVCVPGYLQSCRLNFHPREAPSSAPQPSLPPESSPPASPRSLRWSTPPRRLAPCSSAAPLGPLQNGEGGGGLGVHQKKKKKNEGQEKRTRDKEQTERREEKRMMWNRQETKGLGGQAVGDNMPIKRRAQQQTTE